MRDCNKTTRLTSLTIIRDDDDKALKAKCETNCEIRGARQGFKMKKNYLKIIFAGMVIFILQSCLESTVNRTLSSGSSSPSSQPNIGLHITNACTCKNGVLTDGSISCGDLHCSDSNNFANKNMSYLTLTIGKDIYNPVSKESGNSFIPTKPLVSVCTANGYKCRIKIDEQYVVQVNGPDGYILEDRVDTKYVTVPSQQNQALITAEAADRSIVRLNDQLKKPINTITFEILKNNPQENKYEVEWSSTETPSLSIYRGDGKLKTVVPFNAYTCSRAHYIANSSGGGSAGFTMEMFNFTSEMPRYYFTPPYQQQNQSWPFICHQHGTTPTYVNPSNGSIEATINWNVSSPSLPEISNGNIYAETPGQNPAYPRLNGIFTGISLWGLDSDNFNISNEALALRLTFDIDRRVYTNFMNNSNNGEWIEAPIFSEFTFDRVPDPTIGVGASGQLQLHIAPEVRYIMEPQPQGTIAGPRYSYRCPTKDDLTASDDGRLASIASVLKNEFGILRYETKPFFAACANGKNLGGGVVTNRRVIYLSYDDIKALMLDNGLSPANIEEYLFGQTPSASFQFKLNQLYAKKQPQAIVNPNSTDVSTMNFRLVSPYVIYNTDQCYTNNYNENENAGLVFGCYPVKLN